MHVLSIIPARGGSKGIPNKNLTTVGGKSLVGLSVEHSLNADLVTRTIVSTDSEEIAEAARQAGAEVPFMRPDELAEDHVLDHPVFAHALEWLKENEDYTPDVVVHLRPTAPYRKSEWIDACVQALTDTPQADSVRSVSEPDQHPYRVFRIGDNGYLDPLMKEEHPEPYLLRRQDLPKMYYYNCVIDVTRPATIAAGSMTGSNILPYIMDPSEVFDIDTVRDLEIARTILE
jgi:N-acylneuraminate cytidylyltransferase